jgi:SAM-dependent methyltransferase
MMRLRYVLILFGSMTLWVACRRTQPPREADSIYRERSTVATPVADNNTYPTDEVSNFDGLVSDFESKDRVIWQKPDMVISLLGDLTGQTVADIGAGTGYFTFRLVPQAQKVIGIDIDPRFIGFMDSIKVHLPERLRDRFESRLAQPDDPGLQPEEADAVVIVNTYGYLENRVAYLKTLRKGMAAGGRLLIIDFKKNNLPVGPEEQFKVSSAQVEQELSAAGFTGIQMDKKTLDYQYIVLANKGQ